MDDSWTPPFIPFTTYLLTPFASACLLCLLSLSDCVHKVLPSPRHKSVVSGSDINLTCHVHDDNIPVVWIKLPQGDPINDDRRKSVRWQANVSELHVHNSTWTDAGIYQCLTDQGFKNDRKTTKSLGTIRLDVDCQLEPQSFNQQRPENNGTREWVTDIGTDVQLFCNASGYSESRIVWVRKRSGDLSDLVFPGKYLNICDVQIEDAGSYVCQVEKEETTLTEIILRINYLNDTGSNNDSTQVVPSAGGQSAAKEGGSFTGFILGMMPPLCISFYIILHLGFRSRYAEERPEEEGGDGLDEIVWEQGLKMTTV